MTKTNENALALLDEILRSFREEVGSNISDSQLFEMFVVEQLLKPYSLTASEIGQGIIGGGNDGGIDGIYGFIDGNLIPTDANTETFKKAKRNPTVELVVVQAKQTPSYSETLIHTLISTMTDLFGDLSQPFSVYAKTYNSDLLEIVEAFRQVYKSVWTKSPKLKFTFFYITRGDSEQVHPTVRHHVAKLETLLRDLFTVDEFSFRFVGAEELKNLSSENQIGPVELRIKTFQDDGFDSFVCLVNIEDYYNFITMADLDGATIRRHEMFDANVREYEGNVAVNQAIRNTLQTPNSGMNFWWLNNGVTVVADEAQYVSKQGLILHNPKIVNGLQTSQEIFEHFSTSAHITDNRQILVRIIATTDEDVRSSVIFATNNQTKVQRYTLLANQQIQKDIERYFKASGYFYDRQKNYYKNAGKPRKYIISIQELAQAVMAIVLQQPNDSRGRPTDLAKKPDVNRIFDKNFHPNVFLNCIKLINKIDDFLKSPDLPNFAQNDQRDIRFQLAMFVVALKASLDGPKTVRDYVKTIEIDEIDNPFLKQCVHHVWFVFNQLRNSQHVEGHRISKNVQFDKDVLTRVSELSTESIPFEFDALANDPPN